MARLPARCSTEASASRCSRRSLTVPTGRGCRCTSRSCSHDRDAGSVDRARCNRARAGQARPGMILEPVLRFDTATHDVADVVLTGTHTGIWLELVDTTRAGLAVEASSRD